MKTRKYKKRVKTKALPSPIKDKMIRYAPNKRVCLSCGRETDSSQCPDCGRITQLK